MYAHISDDSCSSAFASTLAWNSNTDFVTVPTYGYAKIRVMDKLFNYRNKSALSDLYFFESRFNFPNK